MKNKVTKKKHILVVSQYFYPEQFRIYVNLYKAIKKQNVYFRNLVIVTIVNIVINYLFFLVIRTSVAFAVGTIIFCSCMLGTQLV